MDIKVSSLTFLEKEESKTKAIATLVINNEFAIHGIKVVDGRNGEFVQMPQKRAMDGQYNDIVFPINAEARAQINDAVLERYKNPVSIEDLQLIGAYETKCDIPSADRLTVWDENSHSYAEGANAALSQLQAALLDAKQFAANVKTQENQGFNESGEPKKKKAESKIYVSLHDVTNNSYIKAAGQIVLDDAIVITGVKVTVGTVKEKGEDDTEKNVTKNFVNMPSYQNSAGDYTQYAHPITRECYDKINTLVLSAFENIGRFSYKGVNFAELGEKSEISSIFELNNKFAEKLMTELDKLEIPYHAKIFETTTLSVKTADKETVGNVQKELKAALNPPTKQHRI